MNEPYRVAVRYTTVNLKNWKGEVILPLTPEAARDLARKLNAGAREVEARIDRYSKGQLGRTS